MARRRLNFEEDAKKLIKAITDFDEDEENFDLCLQFILSNFRYHKFLDVDSHKITRALEGLHKKFLIHSQDEKAEAFKRLTEEFLERTDIGRETLPNSDLHYGLLSLLIELADSPTTAAYKEKPVEIKDKEEEFDWVSYLREGEETYLDGFNDSSPEWSEDEHDEEMFLPITKSKQQLQHTSSPQPDLLPNLPADEFLACEEETVFDRSRSWLEKNVMIQYWTHSLNHCQVSSGHRSSQLVANWESYMSSCNMLFVTGTKTMVTEHHVLRETLWMLSGIPESFIFSWNVDHFTVNPDIQLSHVTNDTLCSLLAQLCKYGTMVWKLAQFVEEVASTACCITGDGKPSFNQTYQAYASSLTRYLQTFKKEIASLEKRVSGQEETLTLSSLMEKLRPRLHELDILNRVHSIGVEGCYHVESPSQRASHLLAVLYDTLLQCDSLGESQASMVSLLLPIWVQTSKPYLDIIDEWIAKGHLRDPYKEFVIQRNEDVKTLDETFWETAFTLHCSSMIEDITKKEPVSETKVYLSDGRRQTRSKSKPATEKPRSEESTGAVDTTITSSHITTRLTPGFLTPVLEHIILAGKSMEMLQNLGRLAQVVVEGNEDNKEHLSLYEVFLESLERHLGTNNSSETDIISRMHDSDGSGDLFTQNIALQMRVKGIQDPLLRVNFEALFKPDRLWCQSLTANEDKQQRQLENLDMDHFHPVELLLEKCLYPHIRLQCDKVCSKLLQILKEEYSLVHYLTAIRKFLLLEAGDAMYDFYTELFEKLRLQESWQDMSFLNLVLQESLHTRFSVEAERLFVSVDPPVPGKMKPPIHALDGLTLHYKVPWPVDVVLNSKCMSIYNQVFCFLMQIKRAKYCLDELRFTDLSKEDILGNDRPEVQVKLQLQSSNEEIPRDKLIHRMQLFRMRLLHFVNSLHNYIMTRILHTTGLEFQQELSEAHNLDQVIAVHVRYVSRIHERCVLHRNVAFLHNVVVKVLNQALDFQACWDCGADNIRLKTLCDMEDEFSRCITFLSSFLNNVIKRGSHPHLESLAFALITSNEQHRQPASQQT